MSDDVPTRRRCGRIKDARCRSVRQLDPVAMHLLRQDDVIPMEVLRQIVSEKGVRITGKERASLVVGVIALAGVIGLFAHSILTGDFAGGPLARTASLAWFSLMPWVLWVGIKRARFGIVAAAMLKYLRCPHCGYDLRLLPTEPADYATVCPECGCAWKLDGCRAARSSASPAVHANGVRDENNG